MIHEYLTFSLSFQDKEGTLKINFCRNIFCCPKPPSLTFHGSVLCKISFWNIFVNIRPPSQVATMLQAQVSLEITAHSDKNCVLCVLACMNAFCLHLFNILLGHFKLFRTELSKEIRGCRTGAILTSYKYIDSFLLISSVRKSFH